MWDFLEHKPDSHGEPHPSLLAGKGGNKLGTGYTLPTAAGHNKALCWMLLLTLKKKKEEVLRQFVTLEDQIFISDYHALGCLSSWIQIF